VSFLRYQCRRCSHERAASSLEVEFGRVVCPQCGGTCDPTPREQQRINAVRQRAAVRRAFAARFNAGFDVLESAGER
jgi:hypothetical protein